MRRKRAKWGEKHPVRLTPTDRIHTLVVPSTVNYLKHAFNLDIFHN